MSINIAIVGGGPKSYIPELDRFHKEGMEWIGADQGAEVLLENNIRPTIAIGDFDSVSASSYQKIKERSSETLTYSEEKDETDLGLAVQQALLRSPEHILLFGVTGGRMDHTLANVQLLYPLLKQGKKASIIDVQNQVELAEPGTHKLEINEEYPYVSFLPMTMEVTDLTLEGFYYPLEKAYVPFGSTLCISNQLIEDPGTFSFSSGILLVVRSKDLN